MKIEDIADIYSIIASSLEEHDSRKESIALRKLAFQKAFNPLVKIAFDSRRINQETDYIARRGLQNYNRSDAFISEATASKLKCLKELKLALLDLKQDYGKNKGWQDSYCRVLLDTVNKALRTEQKDGDYTDSQPGVGSLDYIEEMLHVRYRLDLLNIADLSAKDLRDKLLSKDKELEDSDINSAEFRVERSSVGNETYDTLIEKLFGGVKATKENPNVERSITITINDKFIG